MVLMAVNRFYRIVKSTKYDHYFTKRKTLLVFLALWFYSIFAPLIGLLKRSKIIFNTFKLFCCILFENSVFSKDGSSPSEAYVAYTFLETISSALDPLIFGVLSKRFRKNYLKAF